MPIFFLAMSPEIWQKVLTILIGAAPITEVRGAIPYALGVAKMGWVEAVTLAVIGNCIPVVPFLLFLEFFSERLMKVPAFNRLLTWVFERTRKKGKGIEASEFIGLAVFVGIPLPMTGAWSGCIAAYLFRIPMRLAIPAIILGILMAATVVTLACLGVISFWGIAGVH